MSSGCFFGGVVGLMIFFLLAVFFKMTIAMARIISDAINRTLAAAAAMPPPITAELLLLPVHNDTMNSLNPTAWQHGTT